MNREEMRLRTREFAIRCVHLAESLPKSIAGRRIAGQLVDCGTSVGANYRAACHARSKREFIAKLGIVEEEADEAAFWIDLIGALNWHAMKRLNALIDEAQQIVRIVVASIKTARGK